MIRREEVEAQKRQLQASCAHRRWESDMVAEGAGPYGTDIYYVTCSHCGRLGRLSNPRGDNVSWD